MKPQKFTTEGTENKKFRFFKSPVNSAIASSLKEYHWIRECKKVKGRYKKTNTMRAHREGEGSGFPVTFLYLKLFSVFSVVNF